MKRLKKAGALVLALLMTFVFAIPAMAAQTYTITAPDNGHTYEVYQIFTGDYSEKDGKPVLANIKWGQNGTGTPGEAVNADVLTELEAIADEASDTAKLNVIEKYATLTSENKFGTVLNGNSLNVPAGYYLIKDVDNALEGQDNEAYTLYIVEVVGNVTITPKSEVPSVEKKVFEYSYHETNGGYGNGYNDVADWNIGDSIPFKLIGTVPDMSAYDTYTYVFHDTLSEGLTVRDDDPNTDPNGKPISVYVANQKDATGDELVAVRASDYKINEVTPQNEDGTSSWTITFTDLKTAMTDPGNNQEGEPVSDYKYILVNYDAYLDSDAVIGLDGNPNEVYLEYSNNPNGTGTGTTTTDQVIVFTYELDGTKVDGENNETKLEDAQFVLLNKTRTLVAKVNATTGKFEDWISVPEDTTYEGWTNFNLENHVILTSDANGLFKVSGLEDDTYYLREIQAPTGYNLLEDDVKVVIAATTANNQEWNGEANTALTGLTVTVDHGDAQKGDIDTGIVNVTVANNQGSTLPETGGMGTTVFYVVGGVIVAGVLVLLVAKRRMGRAE